MRALRTIEQMPFRIQRLVLRGRSVGRFREMAAVGVCVRVGDLCGFAEFSDADAVVETVDEGEEGCEDDVTVSYDDESD